MTNSEKLAAIHASANRGFFVAAGGGSEVFSRLLSVPGASRTVIEARIPYSSEAMTAFLGRRPESFCSEQTARQIAVMAWIQARRFAVNDPFLFGFALTATLATNREHQGEHRAYAAFHSEARTVSYTLELEKGVHTREEEEKIVSDWVLDLIAEFCDVIPQTHTPDRFCDAPKAWRKVLTSEVPFVELHRDGTHSFSLSSEITGIFPGSYNPIHAGHGTMHTCAAQILRAETALELAVLNADKPPLDYVTISERLEQIWNEPTFTGNCVLLSGLPFFEQKAEVFPGRTFVVGMDTLERIADVKYHQNEPFLLEKSLHRLASFDIRFLVFGRAKSTPEGKVFEAYESARIPQTLAELCVGVPEKTFRNDLTSTEIRAQKTKKS